MRKKFTMLLALVLCAFASNVMAQTYYRPGARTTTLEANKKYFISVATWYGGACTKLMYNNNGTLTVSDQLPQVATTDASYLFTVEEVGENKLYYIKNNEDKYLQADNLASTDTKTGVYVIQYFEGKAVCCGNDVDACDENGNKIAYNNINANTPIVTVQKNQDYTKAENKNGWRYIYSLSAGVNWCTAFAFYEAVEVEFSPVATNKVYRIYNKANTGKVLAENTTNFKLHAPSENVDDKSQLWYLEGNNAVGYTFRNLKTADYMNFVNADYTHWGTTTAPIKFYLTKVEEANGTTPDYYAIAFTTTPEKSDLAYTHYSHGNIVRWRAADKSGENYTSVNASLWQFEEVSIEVLATLDASYTEWKNGITQTIEEAKELLTTTAGYAINAVALTTDNTTCPAAVDDNSDGIGVAGLVDNDDATFMHTKYPEKGSYGEHHYIQVDLGENNSAKYITFSYRARHNNHNNNPETIIIKGSVDGTEYTDIQTLTNLPDGLVEYESPIVGNGTAYRYFRFVVTETTNNAKNGEYVFFALGKFRMNTVAINDAYASKITVLENMNEWINSHELAETRPADWCLKTYSEWNTEISDLIYGATLREYPFTLTTDVNAPVCYQILSGRGDANTSYYFTLKPNDGGKVKLETNTKDNVYSYWFFMEEAATGKLVVVPFMEESKPLGYVAVADGNSKLTNVHSTQDFAGYHYEVIEYSGVNGFPYALKPYKANTNVSNHGGTGNFMGFYNGNSDGGTAVKFQPVACPVLEFRGLPAAVATANANCPGDNRTGTMLNGYTTESVNAYKAAVENVKNVYNDASTAAEAINEHKNTLSNLYSVLAINMPEDGKFYRVRCADGGNRRILSTLTAVENIGDRLALANTVTDESIFCYTNGALLSYQTGLFINAYNYNNVGGKSTVTFSKAYNKVLGCYNVSVGDRWIYGSGDYIDSGSGENPDHRNGYNWWLEEVTKLPVAITAAKWATLYAPVALKVPAGVTVYETKQVGDYLVVTPVEGENVVIPAETGVLIFADVTETTTYEFEMTTDQASEIASCMTGSYAKSVKNADKNVYTLQKGANGVGFYLFKGENAQGDKTYINGFRAWVELDKESAVQALRITRGDEEGTTGIESVEANEELVIFDLAGRRVQKMEKGIYIVNGKKVVIK